MYKNDIEHYIPQRSPMIMVDGLLEADDQSARSQLLVKDDNIFLANGVLEESGLIENIAQTAALYAGYRARLHNEPVRLGFIASIRSLKIYDLPPSGGTIDTAMTVVNNVMNVTIAEGVVRYQGKTICTCQMRIFIQQ